MKLNKHACAWIFYFLTFRPQFVKLQANSTVFKSENLVLNVGAPQGTCISPALFTIYTDNCRSQSDNIVIIKFADDTAIQCIMKESTNINDLETYKKQIFNFASWCKDHFFAAQCFKN